MKIAITKEALDELQEVYDAALATAILHPELRPKDFSPENCAMAALLGAIADEQNASKNGAKK